MEKRKEKKNGGEEKVKKERESERASAAIATPVGHARGTSASEKWFGDGTSVFGTAKRFRKNRVRGLGGF